MSETRVLLRVGDAGQPVRDVQRRLTALGFDLRQETPGHFGSITEAAVRSFQEQRGLRADGICGAQTWASLVEASFGLGDRLLYLREPMLRGDDVAALQRELGALGFDAGRVDGIFGPHTTDALARFQRNVALTTDGICGPDTVAALHRVGRGASQSTVAAVREAEELRDAPRQLRDQRFAIGENGGLGALADALGATMSEVGSLVAVLHHPDQSVQASEANGFQAHAFVALAISDEPGCATAFYAAEGFESVGGRRLAHLLLEKVAPAVLEPRRQAAGMRLPLLRETRMPAVVCELGPAAAVVGHTAELVTAMAAAMAEWAQEPLDL
jgi:N-acetylmuramoyl-L-alanine amidase